jgi:copper chaperone CopZ
MMTPIKKFSFLLVTVTVLLSGLGVLDRGNSARAADAPDLQTFTLQIAGMTCGVCVKDIQAALLKVPGVMAVEVQIKTKWFLFKDYADARAVVRCERGKTTVEALVKAVESASSVTSTYNARPVSES